MPRKQVGLNTSSTLLPWEWYQKISNSYENTFVGKALTEENKYTDWQIISIRVVPCNPLGIKPSDDIDKWCWPQIRVVWQPIVSIHESDNYADDRAIHVLYDVDPSLYLNVPESENAYTLLSRIKNSLASNSSINLKQDQIETFTSLRNTVATSFLKETISLRESSGLEYVDVRSEFKNNQTQRMFIKKVKSFLGKVALIHKATEMTSFSLPTGRDPVGADDWSFLKFTFEDSNPVKADISVISPSTGKELIKLGHSARASMARDDPKVYTWSEGKIGTPEYEEVSKNVILWSSNEEHQHLEDRTKVLVPNTTCASCHKIHKTRFNFHSLSYLAEFPLEPSPRVLKDVKLDLDWVNENLNF